MHDCLSPFGGEGGIRTHEHPLRCYWNSSPAPSTARPPLRSITHLRELYQRRLSSIGSDSRGRIIPGPPEIAHLGQRSTPRRPPAPPTGGTQPASGLRTPRLRRVA